MIERETDQELRARIAEERRQRQIAWERHNAECRARADTRLAMLIDTRNKLAVFGIAI
jgi:hypothetical protein